MCVEFEFGFHRFRLHNKHIKLSIRQGEGKTRQSVIVMRPTDQTISCYSSMELLETNLIL